MAGGSVNLLLNFLGNASGAVQATGQVGQALNGLGTNLSRIATQANAMGQSLKAAMQSAGVSPAGNAIQNTTNQVNKLTQTVQGSLNNSLTGIPKRIQTAFTSAQKSLAAVRDQATLVADGIRMVGQSLAQFGGMISMYLGAPILLAFTGAGQAASKLEDALAQVSRTANISGADLEYVGDALRNIARNSRTALTDLAEVPVMLGQSGVESKDALANMTTMMDMFAIGTDQSLTAATDSVIRFSNAFGTDLNTNTEAVWKFINVVNLLAKQTAATASEVLIAATDFAPFGAMLQMQQWQVAAFAATLPSLGLSAHEAGTALKNMANYAIQNIDQVSAAMGPINAAYRDTDNILAMLDKDATQVFRDIINAANNTASKSKAIEVLMDAFGQRGGRAFAVLTNNVEALEKALAMAEAEWGTANSLVADYDRMMSTSAAQMDMFKNNVTDIGITLGSTFMPVVNQIIQVLVPAIRMASDAFAALSPQMKLMIVAGAGIVAVMGPLMMVMGQIMYAASLLFLGFGRIAKVGISMIGVLGELVVGTNAAGVAFLRWPLLVMAGVGGVLAVLNSLGVDIVGVFKGIADGAIRWGENLAASFASGLMAGAVRYVTQAISYVANLIASFFESHSPPKDGPLRTIDTWGTSLMEVFLNGFRQADFDILSEVGGLIERALMSGVEDEGMPDALRAFAAMREKLAGMIKEYNETGVLNEGALNEVTGGLGQVGDNVRELVKLWLQYNDIQQRLAEIEARRKGTIKSYKAEVAAVAAGNLPLEDKIERIRALQRTRDDSLRGLDKEEESLKEQADAVKQQLDFQKSLIGAMQEQQAIFDKIADAINRLSKKKIGGGGGGAEMPAFDDLGDATKQMEDLGQHIVDIKDRFTEGKRELLGFFDAFNGTGKQTEGPWYLEGEAYDMYESLYNLGTQARETRDTLVGMWEKVSGAFATVQGMLGGGGLLPAMDLSGIQAFFAFIWSVAAPAFAELQKAMPGLTAALADFGGRLADTFGDPAVQAALSQILTGLVGLVGYLAGGALAGVFMVLTLVAQGVALALPLLATGIDWLMQALVPVVAWFTQNWPAISASVSAAVGTIVAVLSAIWTAVAPSIMAAMTGIGQAFQIVWAAIQSALPALLPIFQNIISYFTGILPILGGILLGVIGVLTGLVSGILSGLGVLIPSLAAIFTGIWQMLEGTVLLIVNLVRANMEAVVALFTGNWDKVGAHLAGARAALAMIMEGLFSIIIGLVTGAFGTIIAAASGFVDGIIAFFTSLYNTLVGHSIVPDLVNGILSWFASLVRDGVRFFQNLVLRVVAAFTQLLVSVVRIAVGIVTRVRALLTVLQTAWTTITTEAITKATELWNAVVAIWETLRADIASKLSAIGAEITTQWTNFVTTVRAKAGEIWTAVTSKLGEIQTSATETWRTFQTKLEEAFTAAVTTAQSKAKELYDNVTGKIEEIRAWVEGKVAEFSTMGGNIVQGLIDGVTSKAAEFLAVFVKLVEDAVAEAKRKLGISSPAKETEEMGVNVVAGLINGIMGDKARLEAATVSAATTILTAMQNLLLAGTATFSGLVSRILGTFLGTLQFFVALLLPAFNNIYLNVAIFISTVVRYFAELLMVLVGSLLPDIVNGILSWFYQLVTGGVQMVQAMVTGIIETVGALKEDLVAIGFDVISGIWNGMRSAWNQMMDWFHDAVAGLPEIVKKLLGIASPSKVFTALGLNVVDGFANGLDGLGNAFTSATIPIEANVSSLLRSSANQPVAAGAGGGLTVDVTINDPVVREEADLDRLANRVAERVGAKVRQQIAYGGRPA